MFQTSTLGKTELCDEMSNDEPFFIRYLEKIFEFSHYILNACMHVLNQMGQILCLQTHDKVAKLEVNTIFSQRIYMKIEFSSQRREMPLFLTTKRGLKGSRNTAKWHKNKNTAQNNIRNPQTALKLPENFYIPQTAWFCKNAIPQIKIKISAKSHPKSSKTASTQTLMPPPPTWLP